MELWIRSQDRRVLIKVNNVYYNDCEDFIDICSTYYDNRETSLGIYKTKERALEVLDEIQSILEQINDPNLTILPVFVYEMPKE